VVVWLRREHLRKKRNKVFLSMTVLEERGRPKKERAVPSQKIQTLNKSLGKSKRREQEVRGGKRALLYFFGKEDLRSEMLNPTMSREDMENGREDHPSPCTTSGHFFSFCLSFIALLGLVI